MPLVLVQRHQYAVCTHFEIGHQRSGLRLADDSGRASRRGLDGREKARYEGLKIGQSISSRTEHNDGNRG